MASPSSSLSALAWLRVLVLTALEASWTIRIAIINLEEHARGDSCRKRSNAAMSLIRSCVAQDRCMSLKDILKKDLLPNVCNSEKQRFAM